MQLHPRRYFDDTTRVGFVGTLLTRITVAWFAPILEKHHPLSYKISTPLWRNLKQCLGTVTRPELQPTSCVTSSKGHIPIVYASEFRQLAYDVNWGEAALIDQFRYGLRDDVQDLLLTFTDPSSFSEAITQAIWCDNRLFERR
jgi:hypothetical protein